MLPQKSVGSEILPDEEHPYAESFTEDEFEEETVEEKSSDNVCAHYQSRFGETAYLKSIREELQATCFTSSTVKQICPEYDPRSGGCSLSTPTVNQPECEIYQNAHSTSDHFLAADRKSVIYDYKRNEPQQCYTFNKADRLIEKMASLDERADTRYARNCPLALPGHYNPKETHSSDNTIVAASELNYTMKNKRFGLQHDCEKDPDLARIEEEYNNIIQSQATEINNYRNKYIKAQQEVEYQKCIIRKQKITTELIEDQINSEIQRIKDQFQNSLNEYAKYREYMTNEQLKLARCMQEKEELVTKLKIVCRELQTMKNQSTNAVHKTGNSDDCLKIKKIYAKSQLKYAKLLKIKQVFVEKNMALNRELELLRSESAKTIVRMNERARENEESFKILISDLEKELIQCRAGANFALTEQQNIITELQAQLKCVSFNFMCAQRQINSLQQYLTVKGDDGNTLSCPYQNG